jgi:orotate phosphoribosyltransferase
VLVVDDVITAGTAVREALVLIRGGGGVPAGIVIALDREERASDADPRSAARAVAAEQGIPVVAVARLGDLLAFAGENATLAAERERLHAYRARYAAAD